MKAGKITSALLIMLLGLNTLFAQKNGVFNKGMQDPYRAISFGGGSAHYIGDLTGFKYSYYAAYTNVRWNGTINYTRYINPNVAARMSFSWIRLYGDDFTYSQRNFDKLWKNYIRNLHFRNDLQEFVFSGVFNLKRTYDQRSTLQPRFMPYLVAGVGLIGHNPKAIQPVNTSGSSPIVSTTWVPLKQFNTSGQGLNGLKPYSLIVPVIPLAIGFRMKVSPKIDLNFEAGYRLTLSDYIDDVGATSYPDLSVLASTYGADAAAFSFRAGENMHAVSGESRIPRFLQVWANQGLVLSSSTSPKNDILTLYDPTLATSIRGTKGAFYRDFDHYIVTQFTISYVLSGGIKCPTVK